MSNPIPELPDVPQETIEELNPFKDFSDREILEAICTYNLTIMNILQQIAKQNQQSVQADINRFENIFKTKKII